ncbi:MAG: hypothetical protein WA705_16995 [Candidatus Ozemobacteraceae bacterium]
MAFAKIPESLVTVIHGTFASQAASGCRHRVWRASSAAHRGQPLPGSGGAGGRFYACIFRQTAGRLTQGTIRSPRRGPASPFSEDTLIGAEFEGFLQGLTMLLAPSRPITATQPGSGTWKPRE